MRGVLIVAAVVSALGVASCSTGTKAVQGHSAPTRSIATAAIRPCAPGEIDVTQQGVGRITGLKYSGGTRNAEMVIVIADNVSQSPCSIAKSPSWNIIDSSGNKVAVELTTSRAKPGAMLRLAPGDQAQVTLYWLGSGCPDPNAKFGITMKNPDGGIPLVWPPHTPYGDLYEPSCPGHGPTSTGPSEISDTGWSLSSHYH